MQDNHLSNPGRENERSICGVATEQITWRMVISGIFRSGWHPAWKLTNTTELKIYDPFSDNVTSELGRSNLIFAEMINISTPWVGKVLTVISFCYIIKSATFITIICTYKQNTTTCSHSCIELSCSEFCPHPHSLVGAPQRRNITPISTCTLETRRKKSILLGPHQHRHKWNVGQGELG